MNISHTQHEAGTACTVKVNIERGDYAPQAEKRLREQRAKANMPGFRKGMVPLELVRKMYAPAIELDVVQDILGQELHKYLQEQGIKPLGDPIPAETGEADVRQEDGGFAFVFDVALTPQLSFVLDKGTSIPYYKRELSEEFLEEQIGLLRKLFAPREKKEEKEEKGETAEDKAVQAEGEPVEVDQAELNQEFFDRMFGEGAVSDEAGFREKMRERIAESLDMEPDYRFLSDVRREIVRQLGDVPLADDVLKRWLVGMRKEDAEAIEKDYPSVREDIVRQLVEAELHNRASIQVTPEEVIRQLERTSALTFAQATGCYVPPRFFVQQCTMGAMNRKEDIQRMTEVASERLLIQWLKEQITVEVREEPAK
jgi:FKBP-type peptidyl-prolyl cis-trans isomerase (trigger factor)